VALLSNGDLSLVGLADSSPRSYAQASYYPGTGLAQAGGQFAAYGEIYKRQLWVATLVNKLAYGTARLPLKVYSRSDDSRTEARDTAYAKLIRTPNSQHDPFFFWLHIASTFELYGEALLLKVRPRPGAAPLELWPMHPSRVTTARADDGSLVYRYFSGAQSAASSYIEWPASEIVHFRSYNPDDQVRGLSRLEPLRATLLNEDAARRATTAFWNKGARPGMALSHPSNLSQPAQERLKAQFDSIAAGADNTGSTVVLEEGMTPQVLSLSAEEAQYIETRKLNREEVCAVYDVPPPVVHILDRATFSNITEQMRSMYRDTMAPRLSLYESVLDTQLRPDFDPRGDLYAEFLMDEVLRGSFEERVAAYKDMFNIGGMTPAEIRRAENRPRLGPETDALYVNAATVALSKLHPSADGATTAADKPFQDVGLPALIAAGIVSPAWAAEQVGAPTAGLSNVAEPTVVLNPASASTDTADAAGVSGVTPAAAKCVGCGTEAKTSARQLCRACEGRRSRQKEQP
jgi:HK97 family phage portal protein